ncbi:MAG: flippase-like domain-containing protein, partial [Acidimicrobiia bacterium]|nr:flippase-like domain-containing protein [Acidimicrobiia bacterium]
EVVDGAWGLLVGACISELGAKWTFGELFREGAEKAGTPVRRWVALRAALVGTGVARLIPAGGAITPVAMSWASGKKGTAGAALRATILNYAGLMLATGAGVLWVWGRYSPAGLESLGPVFGVALLAAGLALVGLTTRLRIIAWMVPSRWRAKAERALSEHPLTIRSWLLLTARVVLEAITLDLTLRAFGVQLVPSQVIAAFGLSQLVGGLPGPPGGLGITEAGLMGVLAVFGISTAAALTPVLVFRVVSYWIPAAVGVIAGGMRFAAGRPAVIGEGDRVGETIKADRDGSG